MPKSQTTSAKHAKNVLLWARWSAFWDNPWRVSIWRARWCVYGRGACDDVMPRTHRSAMRQDAMTSTPFTCTMLDNASMNCLMILRLRPFCMRLGMPFVAQETSTVTPCW